MILTKLYYDADEYAEGLLKLEIDTEKSIWREHSEIFSGEIGVNRNGNKRRIR